MERIPTYKPPRLVPTVRPKAADDRKADVRFYVSARWKRLAAIVRNAAHGLCQRCGQPPTRKSLEVHHKKPRKTHPELAYDLDNLEALCTRCHNAESDR